MIPQRVKLSGFLSYKDEQEVRFDGASLWMLSGSNGSGKSSIFDAVTFALFGHHRGGSQSVLELINKESNTLAVEFDFTVEGQLYRIKRTVRRRPSGPASTQQVLKKLDGDDHWEAVPDTHIKTKLDAWVKDKIGLDYETFTSSVLLLQGKSEKLLDSTPAGRAGVLARIVDLERYQKLHALADDKRRQLKAQLEEVSNQLAGLRDVTEEELASAVAAVDAARQARDRTTARIDSLLARESQARLWDEARRKLAAARARLATAESVLRHAVAIERDFHRLRELRDVLPAVGILVTERGRISESLRKTEQLTRQLKERGDDRRRTENALNQARSRLADLKKTQAENEDKREKLTCRIQELTAILEKVKQFEQAGAEAERLDQELRSLPADPEATVRQLLAEQERLALLAQHVATLTRLHADRSELVRLTAEEQNARAEEERIKQLGLSAKEALTSLEAEVKQAGEERARAQAQAASAQALARHAQQLLEELDTLTGRSTCRVCGQPLTVEHLADEKKRRARDAQAARRKADDLAAVADQARQREEQLLRREADQRQHLAALRESYLSAQNAVKMAAKEITRLAASCRQSYHALPDEFKSRFGPTEPTDWTAVTFPDRHDLARLEEEAKQIDGLRRRLRLAQDQAAQVQGLRARRDSARERLEAARRSLPAGDPARFREEFASRQSEKTALTEAIQATSRAIAQAEKDVDTTLQGLAKLDRELTELSGRLSSEEQSRKQSAEAIERAKKMLPQAWHEPVETAGLTEQLRWKEEYDRLVAAGTEKKFTDLQAARGSLESLRAEVVQLEQEELAFPSEARRSPEDVKAEVSAARAELDARNRDLLDAQTALRELERLREERRQLNDRHKALDVAHSRYKKLAELLGRDRLQRFLVRKAESQIVDYANAVLDRLSGGQLFLRLVGGDDGGTDKALELECANRVTGGAPINVAFLSGSQRFRVAVALALAIGQYASKQHRPIESVIIDEGFGCLDRAGRQVMIQELQNLRGQLRCILLVSHQEEFADAFPDGYRFELQGGTTKVSRFAR